MTNKKTVMMELFGIIESEIGKSFPEEIKRYFIKLEREQIEEAFLNGTTEQYLESGVNPSEYYTQTFKP